MDSKKVIEKLFSIASKQQQMIMKLAQAQDPNVAYLQQTAEVAAMNLNTGLPISIQVSLGSAGTAPDEAGVSTSPNYVIRVGGLKNDKQKMEFKSNLDRTLAIQKPELSAGISVIYS